MLSRTKVFYGIVIDFLAFITLEFNIYKTVLHRNTHLCVVTQLNGA